MELSELHKIESQEGLVQVLDILPVPVIIHVQGEIRYLNRLSRAIIKGISKKDPIGMKVTEFVDPKFHKSLFERVQETMRKGANHDPFYITVKTLDGNKVDIKTKSAKVIFDGEEGILVVAQNLTEQQEKSNELAEKNLLIEKIAEAVPDILQVVDVTERKPVFENGNVFDLLGYDRDNIDMDEWEFLYSILHPDDLNKVMEAAKKLVASKSNEYLETEYRLKDSNGEWRWISSRSTVLKRRNDGTPLLNFAIARDVTEQKEAEERLLASQYSLQLAQSTAKIGYWEWNVQTNEISWSDEMYRIYEVEKTEGQAPLTDITDYVHPDDREEMMRSAANSIEKKGEEVGKLEFRIVTPGGKVKHVHGINRHAEMDGSGEVLKFFGTVQDITERKAIEEELKRNQLFNEKISRTIPDMIFVYDCEEQVNIYSNLSGRKFLGYTEEEWNNMDGDTIRPMSGVDVQRIIDDMQKLPEGGVMTREEKYVAKDGQEAWVQNRSTVFTRNEQGDIQQILLVASDVTEKKKNEEKILLSEKYYRTIASNLPNASVVIFDKDLKFLLAEGTLFKRQGYNKEEIEGATAYDILPDGRNWNFFIPYFQRVLQGERFYFEKPFQQFIYMINLLPVKDEQGEIIGGMNITLDIYDIKQTEEKLAEVEDLRNALIEGVPDLVFHIKKDGTCLDVITSKEVGLLNPINETIGQSITNGLPEDIVQKYHAKIDEALRHGSIENLQYELKIGEGQQFYEARFSPVKDDELLVLVRNFTELREAQMNLSEKIDELSSNNAALEKYITSNTELEKFAYIASHDLKEPLRTIVGFAQLLEKRYKTQIDKEAEEYIGHIIEGTKRMESLIQGLLEYSRVESKAGSLRMISFEHVLEQVLADLRNAIEENNVQIEFKDLPEVKADSLQLRQLLQNLITNSIKFRSEDDPRITISAKDAGEAVEFKIEDNGIGFDMQYKDRVFEIFQRLNSQRSYAGSGIGLAICKRIVERHGGQIWVQSKPEKGSTFYFTLKT